MKTKAKMAAFNVPIMADKPIFSFGLMCIKIVSFYYIYIYIYIYIYKYIYIYLINRRRPQGSLLNSCNTELWGRALLYSQDCSTLPLFLIL